MVYFIEPLVKQHLWHWLETEQGWRVDGEVGTGNGRIDLACETPDGAFVGIELKAGDGMSWSSTLSEQIWRYVDSGRFDEIYFASSNIDAVASALNADTVEPLIPVISQSSRKLRAGVQAGDYTAETVLSQVESRIDDTILDFEFSGQRYTVRSYITDRIKNRPEHNLDPVSIDEGIQELSRAVLPDELGLIEVPLPLTGEYLRSPRMALTPGESHDPTIVREAERLSRADEPIFSWEEEPWVRHNLWQEFGGLPEGSIPNVRESAMYDRPIDIVAFEGVWDPTDIVDGTSSGEVIGIEAKGNNSFAGNSVVDQLKEYIEPGVFSKFYLAVPLDLQQDAEILLDENTEICDQVGVITVSKGGDTKIVREAAQMDLQHDGYKRKKELCKTGYGDIDFHGRKDIISPFDLPEWRDPLTDDEGEEVIWDYNPLETKYVVHDVSDLSHTPPDEPRETLIEYTDSRSIARAYLLVGYSADPYGDGPGENNRAPRYGYIRLSVKDFETDDGEYGIKLHFGGGSWEGGYVCLVGDQVEYFISVLSSLEYIGGGEIIAQGRYIDLEEFRWEYGGNYEFCLAGDDANPENLMSFIIEAVEMDDGLGARFRLGEQDTQGVEVEMTNTQRIDLLRLFRLIRYGRKSEIPSDGGGYQRVGPDGEDTWDKGTSIEDKHNPSDLPTSNLI